MRDGESTKTTMASGGGGLIGATGGAVEHGGTLQGSETQGLALDLCSGSPTMPHLELRGEALDSAYPPLPVPQDELLPDAARDEDDVVYQSGLRAAEAIRRETADHGRKHRMSPNANEPEKRSAESEEQSERHNFEIVALVHDQGYDGCDLHHDVPGTPHERHRDRCVTTEHADHDYDDHGDDDHDYEELREDKEEKATLR